MITTKELRAWEIHANLAQARAFAEAQKHAKNVRLSEYFLHLAKVADAQSSILNRLIRQSEADDRNNGRAKQ